MGHKLSSQSNWKTTLKSVILRYTLRTLKKIENFPFSRFLTSGHFIIYDICIPLQTIFTDLYELSFKKIDRIYYFCYIN